MPSKLTHLQFLQRLTDRNDKHQDNHVTLLEDQIYNGLNTKLKFKCTDNHIFVTAPRYIIQKESGCPICSSKRASTKNIKCHDTFIKELNDSNKKYENGIKLKQGETYKGTYNYLWFMCEQGHEFQTLPKTVIRGSGCPQCKHAANKIRHTHTSEEFQKLLEKRNQKFPFKKVFLKQNEPYITQNKKSWFVCEDNHVWCARPGDIIHRAAGCPICANHSFSYKAIQWLNEIQEQENIVIQHAINNKEYIIPNTRFKVDGFCYETNTVYEFYGDYWHGNPKTTNHTLLNEITDTTFAELYSNTMAREQEIKKLGYNIISIWESDYDKNKTTDTFLYELNKLNITSHVVYLWKFTQLVDNKPFLLQISKNSTKPTIHIFENEWNDNQTLLLSKLKHYTNQNNTTQIHARKCSIRSVNQKEKSAFLNQFHIQGNDNAQIAYGAYYNNELTAIMTFSKPRVGIGVHKNKKENSFELVRFTTNINYRIPGIASKLLKHFQRNNQWAEIYSYADRRWSVGNLYYKLGFQLVRTNPPDYFYIVDGKRKHRWNYRKDILKKTLPNYDSNLTEYQNMVNHGYYRVWDCGTLKFSMIAA